MYVAGFDHERELVLLYLPISSRPRCYDMNKFVVCRSCSRGKSVRVRFGLPSWCSWGASQSIRMWDGIGNRLSVAKQQSSSIDIKDLQMNRSSKTQKNILRRMHHEKPILRYIVSLMTQLVPQIVNLVQSGLAQFSLVP
ncbi:hypothetical protein AKJ16_DCAP16432 [Drosera capensis]